MNAADLKAMLAATRPAIEQMLDAAEELSTLRTAATEKGLDWSQFKSLVKAQVQDERDGTGEGKRVKKIIERADFASAYADMLGLAKMNENKKIHSSSPAPEPPQKPVERASAPSPRTAAPDLPDLPPFLDRREKATA